MRDDGWSEILRLVGEYAGPIAMLVALPLITWAAVVRSPYYRDMKARAMKRNAKDKS